jgi:chromosome segregation ATPase
MSKNVTVIMGIMVASCVVATGQAWAQMQQQAAEPQQSEAEAERTQLLEEMNTVQERARVLQQRINTIAQQAEEANPDLQTMHADLMGVYQKKLAEYGYPSEAELQQLREMQQSLQAPGAGEMDEGERQQLTQQFNAGVAKLQQAQDEAQRDTEVQAAQQAFEQARSKAMSEIDSEAQALEREFAEVQGKLEHLRMQLQQMLQAPQQ